MIYEQPFDKDGLKFSCAAVLDSNRIFLGGEDGLLLFDCTEETLQRLGERRISHLERCEQFIVFMGMCCICSVYVCPSV